MSAATLALDRPPLPTRYQRPTVDLSSREIEENEFCWPCVLFIIFCVTFTIALAYAAYCTLIGGSPNISFQWWPPGFIVQCLKWG